MEFIALPPSTPFIVVAYGKDLSKNNFFLAPGLSAVDLRRLTPAAPESQALVPVTHSHTQANNSDGRVGTGQILTPRVSADLPTPPPIARGTPRVKNPFPYRPRNEETSRPSHRVLDVSVNLPPLYPTPNAVQPSPVVTVNEPGSISNLSDSLIPVSEPNASHNVPLPPNNAHATRQPSAAPELRHPPAITTAISRANEVARLSQPNRLPDRHSSMPTNIRPNVGYQITPPSSSSSNTQDGAVTPVHSHHYGYGQPRLHQNASLPASVASAFANCMVPWSDTPITVHSRGGLVRIALPPYTEVVGFAAGEHSFPKEMVEVLDLNGSCDVHLPDGNVYTGVQGIIYPHALPTTGNVLCRHTGSDMHPKPRSHLASAGLALLDDDHTRTSTFVLRSIHHYAEKVDHRRILCDPHHLPQLPPELACSPAGHNGCHIVVESRWVPIAVMGFCSVVLSIPGFVQRFGSADRQWGDIFNQIIGTGSVLLFAVLGVFERLFGTQLVSRRSLEGCFNVTSNAAAKLFARGKVETIEKFACDPRVCPKLVKAHRNSAVRAQRDGWLKVGEAIPSEEMIHHGYVVIPDNGVVLDLLDAHFYTCTRKKEGKKRIRINRPDRKRGDQICTSFIGDEVFA